MLKKIITFTKSLKFKLTIWYSLVLSIFCILFLILMNIWVGQYMSNWNPDNRVLPFLIERVDRPLLNQLSEDQVKAIKESRLRDVENIKELSIYSVVPLIVLSFFGGYVLASLLLKPLDDLNSAIKKKEIENIYEEIPFDDNGDEISSLIKSFNRMSNRLGRSFDSQRQFTENASHEIKTPLAVVSANIDLALDDGDISKEEAKDLLLSSKKQVKYMNSLVSDLLLMSISGEVDKEELDLWQLLESVCSNVDTSNFKLDLINLSSKEKKFLIDGNKILLERAFMNIIENSVKYSDGTKLEINVKREKNNLSIHLRDDGKGIPEDSKERVFERFYRVDKGRSRNQGGFGLGLSITKKILEIHNAKIYLNREYNNGAEFVIIFENVRKQ